MDNRPLKTKALEVAIRELSLMVTPDLANKAYKKWEVFHREPQFMRAVEAKKAKFKKTGKASK